MAYSDNKVSLKQTATNAAAVIVAAEIKAGLHTSDEGIGASLEGITGRINQVRDNLFDDLVVEFEASRMQENTRPQTGYVSRPATNFDLSNPLAITMNSGKFKGQTVEEIINSDKSYAEWYASSGPNPQMRKAFAKGMELLLSV